MVKIWSMNASITIPINMFSLNENFVYMLHDIMFGHYMTH